MFFQAKGKPSVIIQKKHKPSAIYIYILIVGTLGTFFICQYLPLMLLYLHDRVIVDTDHLWCQMIK